MRRLKDLLSARQDDELSQQQNWRRTWRPAPGNMLFTLLIAALVLWITDARASSGQAPQPLAAASTGVVAYQGRLADSAGTPLNSTVPMTFRLYAAATGGAALWTEQRTSTDSVMVSNGLFNVMLGSITPIPQATFTANPTLWLSIAVGADAEMTPRVQLGSVPFAFQALTVPDSSITPAKLDRSYLQSLSGNNAKIQHGSVNFPNTVCTNIGIDFPQSFSSPPTVIITQREATSGAAGLVTYLVTESGFRVVKYDNCATVFNIDWIAIGR